MTPTTQPLFWRDKTLPYIELRKILDGRKVRYAPHSHLEWSLGAILDGQSEFICADRLYSVECGTLVMMNPTVVHACNPLQNSPWAYYMMHLDKNWLGCLLYNAGITNNTKWRDTPIDTLAIPRFYKEFVSVCASLMTVALSSAEKQLILQDYLVSLFSYMYSCAEKPKPALPLNTLYRVANYLNQYCLEDTSIELISAEFGLSTGYMTRTFKRQFNMTPHAYRLNCRIQLTQQALKAGNTIVQVAYDAGFSDQAHFQRVFKQRVAATPNQYRRTVC